MWTYGQKKSFSFYILESIPLYLLYLYSCITDYKVRGSGPESHTRTEKIVRNRALGYILVNSGIVNSLDSDILDSGDSAIVYSQSREK